MRIIHIVAGALWVGGFLAVAAFILPTARAVGPQAGPFVQHLMQVRRMPNYIVGLAFTTILSGLVLYWRASAGFQPVWIMSPPGVTFGVGGLLAITALTLGMAVNLPAQKRLASIGAVMADAETARREQLHSEVQRLQRRLMLVSRTIAALLLLALTAMTLGWHVRW